MSGQPITCQGCPIYGVSTGFVLGSGNPVTAKIGLLLEAPGSQEIVWRVEERDEVERRRLAYPNMEEHYLSRGQPVVGPAGATLFQWMLAPLQLTRRDLFIDNTLRCLPPKSKQGPYPTGAVRKKAEAYCRQYDRWDQFNPTVSLVQIHPSAVTREPTPLPLAIKVFEKAKHFSLGGERPLVMCGGKAVGMWMGHGTSIQTWIGHYEPESSYSHLMRERRREEGMKVSTTKVKKVKKLTAKVILQRLVEGAQPTLSPEGEVGYESKVAFTEVEYQRLVELAVPKGKK